MGAEWMRFGGPDAPLTFLSPRLPQVGSAKRASHRTGGWWCWFSESPVTWAVVFRLAAGLGAQQKIDRSHRGAVCAIERLKAAH